MFDFDEIDELGGDGLVPAAETAPQLPELSPGLKTLFGPLAEKTPVEEIRVQKGIQVRVVTISDIHIDHKQNLKWFEKHLPKRNTRGQFNVLILPGDVSDDLAKLRDTLQMFVRGFDLVCYTPGNHDIWVSRTGSPPDSMAKLREILKVCDECKVRTKPVRIKTTGNATDPTVLLVPLLSFYTSAWDREMDMPWTPKEQMEMQNWTDFRAIKWPQQIKDAVSEREAKFLFGKDGTSPTISELFAATNEPWLEELIPAEGNGAGPDERECIVISYSHYLPRQELFPEKRFLVDGNLHKVSGSIALEHQIRRLRPNVHVFGHTHLTVDLELEGQRYVQWALGTPSEQGAMTRAVGDTGMLVVYDSGGDEPHVAPVQVTFWGRFFAKGRNPQETCPASFVRGLFKRLYPQAELPFDDAHFFTTPNPGPPPDTWEGLFEARWRV